MLAVPDLHLKSVPLRKLNSISRSLAQNSKFAHFVQDILAQMSAFLAGFPEYKNGMALFQKRSPHIQLSLTKAQAGTIHSRSILKCIQEHRTDSPTGGD